MHIVSFSFDDGFERSSVKTAAIFERAGLRACFNVLASPETFVKGVTSSAPPIKFGDFDLWNDFKSRGHEVMPHGYRHANKAAMPFEEAKALILRCLEVFDKRLNGFDRKRAVFNFPYNAITDELVAWLPTVVRACRGGGIEHGINPLPTRHTTHVRTVGFGPADCGEHAEQCIDQLLRRESGWLVYNSHGLDGEGWGPMQSDRLERILDRLKAVPSVRVWSVGETFDRLAR